MIHKEVEWTHQEIECVVSSLFEVLIRLPLINEAPRCQKLFLDTKIEPQTVILMSCAERGYNWDCKDAYMTTGINGAQTTSFCIKKEDKLWMNSHEIATKMLELSINFPGWRYLFIKGTDGLITFELHGGKYEWGTPYC